jgi:hypothetical protein
MADEEPFDCVRMMREIRAEVGRELAGKTPEERVRWIEEEAAKRNWLSAPPPTGETARLRERGPASGQPS